VELTFPRDVAGVDFKDILNCASQPLTLCRLASRPHPFQGRPIVRQGESTKDRIIQAALKLFVRQGYHGTSINDIMQKVRVTKAAFYSHFDSKGQLLLRIISEYETRYIDRLMGAVAEHAADPIGKLHRAISFSADFAVKNPDLCLFLDHLTTELKANAGFLPALKKVHDKYRHFLRDIIAEGIEQGLINKEYDPDLTAVTFMAVHQGVLNQWSLHRYQLNGKKYVRNYRRVIMNGLTS
jgi:AcrR family transcriptional regulator